MQIYAHTRRTKLGVNTHEAGLMRADRVAVCDSHLAAVAALTALCPFACRRCQASQLPSARLALGTSCLHARAIAGCTEQMF